MPWKETKVLPPSTVRFLNRYHKNHPTETNKLAYLAGIIDGEGHVKIEKWGVVRLVVGMTDKETPEWLYKTYGGTLAYLDKHRKDRKNVWIWRLNNSLDNLKLLIMIYPFLLIKRKKVFECIKLLQNRLIRHKAFTSLRGLRFRG